MLVRAVEAFRSRVEMLPVDFQSVESPLLQRLAGKIRRVLPHARNRRTKVLRIPPADLAGGAVRVPQQPVGMLALGA